MKTYRVSHVERFRQFENDDDAEAESLIASILGTEAPSTAMQAGTAFHKALEAIDCEVSSINELSADSFTFSMAEDISVELAPIREIRSSKIYLVDGEPIRISGQADQISGKRVDDHKTTSRFDPDRYMSGYQWRLYLDIFECDTFRWNVFEIAEREPRFYDVFAVHQLEQCRYIYMVADCQALVERFARFVRQHVEPTFVEAL